MNYGSIYAGLPAEFSPPQKAALRLAGMGALTERTAYFDRIPELWQRWIAHQASIEIAGVIVALPTKEARKAALLEAPGEWRIEIRAHVLRLWRMPATEPQEASA